MGRFRIKEKKKGRRGGTDVRSANIGGAAPMEIRAARRKGRN